MHKNVFLFEKIKDPVTFERFLKEEIMGFLMKLDGFVKFQLTNITPIVKPVPETFTETKFMLESYFEKIEDVEVLFTYDEGLAWIGKLVDNPHCVISTYIAQEHNMS